MDIVYQRGRVSVADVLKDLPDPPTYSTVRGTVGNLGGEGVPHPRKDGKRYIYRPTQPRHLAGRSALKQIFQTFFDKSVEKTVIALVSEVDLSDAELDRLSRLIEQAKKGGTSSMMRFIETLYADPLLKFLVDTTIKSFVIFAVAGLFACCLRRKSAAVRGFV